MTDKNTLQNWFRTGAKPSQEQFWAWMESFWHKSESIPIAQIEGISQILENKADTEMLQYKANLEATNLTPENILAWKEKLGVGELPPNIATIDQNGENGNTYTKEKVDELLENSGKNLGNADLKISEGEVRVLDVTGAKIQVKGLNNKKTDASFTRRIKANEHGELAYSDEADVSFVFPETFTATLNVNHIYPSKISERPAFADDLRGILENYRNYQFTPVTKSDFSLNTIDDKFLEFNKINSDGSFELSTENGIFNPYTDNGYLVSLVSNIPLPEDKNWILKISGSVRAALHGGNIWVGISRGKAESISHGMNTSSWSTLNILGENKTVSRENFLGLIIKTGGVITVFIYSSGNGVFHSFNAFPELGDYYPKIDLRKGTGVVGKMWYKILED